MQIFAACFAKARRFKRQSKKFGCEGVLALISSNRAFLKKIDLYVFETIGVSSSYPRVLLILLESTLEESKTTSLGEGYKERRFYKIGHCCFGFR